VLRLYLVIVIRCYFISHPPPCATFDVYYSFLTLFPVAYSVHEVLPRLFPLSYVRRVFRAVNKVGGFTGGGDPHRYGVAVKYSVKRTVNTGH